MRSSVHGSEQMGFSLIEVIITMVILSVGLLGLAGLQARAHTAEAESFSRAQALILANDLADRMATNRVEARKGAASAYNTATVQGTGNASVTCSGLPSTTSIEMAVKDLCEWDQALKGASQTSGGSAVGGISGARGCIGLQTAPIQQFVVTVAWAGRGELGSAPADRPCASAAIPTGRRVVSVTVPFADLDN
jgi:type IV pilus assembly protein PilV